MPVRKGIQLWNESAVNLDQEIPPVPMLTLRLGTDGVDPFSGHLLTNGASVTTVSFIRTLSFARVDSAAGLRPIGAKSPMRDSRVIGPERAVDGYNSVRVHARRMEWPTQPLPLSGVRTVPLAWL